MLHDAVREIKQAVLRHGFRVMSHPRVLGALSDPRVVRIVTRALRFVGLVPGASPPRSSH